MMSKVDPKDGAALHSVAVDLQKRFCPDTALAEKQTGQKPAKPDTQGLPVVVNAPLDFELKGLNREHPYLFNRGFSKETIEHFGLGFCSRGYLKRSDGDSVA